MASTSQNIPIGNSSNTQDTVVRSAADLGELVRERRHTLGLKQTDVAGLGGTGNRFVIELERGKPTVQLQKALDVLSLLGLEVIVRPRAGGQP